VWHRTIRCRADVHVANTSGWHRHGGHSQRIGCLSPTRDRGNSCSGGEVGRVKSSAEADGSGQGSSPRQIACPLASKAR
jgi:hypothetical protein